MPAGTKFDVKKLAGRRVQLFFIGNLDKKYVLGKSTTKKFLKICGKYLNWFEDIY